MEIKAVVFDIGNVLLRWAPEAFFDRALGESRRRSFFRDVPILQMNAEVDLGADMYSSAIKLSEEYPDWSDEIMLWHDNWLEMASPPIDHSVRLLRALRRAGCRTFALSNFGKTTIGIAEQNYPFLEEFDRRFISGEIGLVKPDPEIYAHLEKETGYAGAELLFTDDMPANIGAANARGWQTHLFDGPEGFANRLVAAGLLSEEDAR